MTLEQALLAAVTALASCVVYLYKKATDNHARTMEMLDKCEKQHLEAQCQISQLVEKVALLTSLSDLFTALHKDIKDLTDEIRRD